MLIFPLVWDSTSLSVSEGFFPEGIILAPHLSTQQPTILSLPSASPLDIPKSMPCWTLSSKSLLTVSSVPLFSTYLHVSFPMDPWTHLHPLSAPCHLQLTLPISWIILSTIIQFAEVLNILSDQLCRTLLNVTRLPWHTLSWKAFFTY